MHKRVLCMLIVLGVLVFRNAFAVSEAAVLSLMITPSPQARAMGESFGNVWADDPQALWANPAAAGFFAQNNMVGLNASKMNWLRAFGSDMWYKSYAVAGGFNLKNSFTLGFGLNHHYLNLGKQVHTDETGAMLGTFKSYENATSLTAAVAYHGAVNASLGFSLKFIESNLGAGVFVGDEFGETEATASAYDFGGIVEWPILASLQKGQATLFGQPAQFDITPGLNYSIRNIGDEITYIDAAQKDPLPRTALLGYNLSAKIHLPKFDSDLISINYSHDVHSMLIDRKTDGTFTYKGGLGDIRIWDHLIRYRIDSETERIEYEDGYYDSRTEYDNVILTHGLQVNLFDAVYFRFGGYMDKPGKVEYDSKGYGVNFMQVVRVLLDVSRQHVVYNALERFIKNFDIEYNYSELDISENHPLANTTLGGLTLRYKF